MHRFTILTVIAAAMMASCSNNRTSDKSDVLVAVGEARLTTSDLRTAMPGGLKEADSVKFAHAYIRAWIDEQLISEIAAKEIDLTQIDKMVEQYRKELISWEYNRRMYDSHHTGQIPEDSIRSYYDKHSDELRLTNPMIKGIYIKIANDSESLPALRTLYRSTSNDALDKIEKTGLKGAMHYDYFLDKWIDWEQIESLIPYNFVYDGDTFTRVRRNLDFSDGTNTYLLNIADVLHTGQKMPYEVARELIIDRLTFQERKAYELELKEKLYNSALQSGALEVNCDL